VTFQSRFLREIAGLGLPVEPDPFDPVTDSDLAGLPEPAQRYLRFMGFPGRSRDWSFRLAFRGRFRRRRDRGWMACEAWQYNSGPAVARIMHLRLRAARLIPIVGRDTYLNGSGRMVIKVLDRFRVGDRSGVEYDIGELVTYLNDAVLMAPSMLLVPEVFWRAVDGNSFDLTLTDRGTTVSARVSVDERGRPVDFSTCDRFLEDPERPQQLLRARWSTPISSWTMVEGRPLPSRARALWHLADGDFPYADFRLLPETVAFNVAPGR